MTDNLVLVPTLDAYVAAFAAIEDKVTDKQRRMLTFHHASPGRVVSATTLADEVGYSGYEAANGQYGRLAARLCRELGLNLGSLHVGVLVDFVSTDQAANEHILWVMRERVALALEELGWVPKVAQYLYPHHALRALAAQGTDQTT